MGREVRPNFLSHSGGWDNGLRVEYHVAILEDKTVLTFPQAFQYTLGEKSSIILMK